MRNEQHQSDSSEFDLAVVWRTAQYRRAEDIGPWLGRWLEKTRAWVLAVTAARQDAPAQKIQISG